MTVLNPNSAEMRRRGTVWLGLLIGLPERRAAAKRTKEERRQAMAARRVAAVRAFSSRVVETGPATAKAKEGTTPKEAVGLLINWSH
jgi:hypothetical protein